MRPPPAAAAKLEEKDLLAQADGVAVQSVRIDRFSFQADELRCLKRLLQALFDISRRHDP